MKKVIALMIFIIFASFLSVIFYKSKAGDKKKLILKSEAERFINVFEDNKDNIVLASIKKDIFSDSSVDPNSVFKKISVTDIRFFPKETAAFVTIEIIIGKNGQRLKNIEEFDSKFISEKNYEKSKTFSANNYSEKIKIENRSATNDSFDCLKNVIASYETVNINFHTFKTDYINFTEYNFWYIEQLWKIQNEKWVFIENCSIRKFDNPEYIFKTHTFMVNNMKNTSCFLDSRQKK